ncbi:MAG: hypothetical protein KUG77_29640 [Nannocystaceae bacterium]|nr:hypothetical protein [Nannocystaceae bacterium]
MDGAGPSIGVLVAGDSSVLVVPVDEFLRHAGAAVQFDWGDFFLCASREAADSILAGEDYARSVSKSAATVRAVDDEDFFVYGQDETLLSEIRAKFPGGEWRRGALDELEFPE